MAIGWTGPEGKNRYSLCLDSEKNVHSVGKELIRKMIIYEGRIVGWGGLVGKDCECFLIQRHSFC